ncbi:RNA polymerase II transcription factor B subunit 4 [Quaeritorhiza haematococci]|nr:RNA polymerase II transcription factor B subunit 4 [Quaeritorhiza haematococci]
MSVTVLVIDTNPVEWARAAKDLKSPVEYTKVLEQLMIFIHAHLALQYDNRLAIIASHTTKRLRYRSEFLYPAPQHLIESSGRNDSSSPKKPANAYKDFWHVDQQVIKQMKALITGDSGVLAPNTNKTALAAALSRALTYVNRMKKMNDLTDVQARVLIISVSPDSPSQYIPLMNSIFSAQKMNVPLDVCKLFGKDTVFLPQAAYITGGSYLTVEKPDVLVQYLLYAFLPGKNMRQTLILPSKEGVDFRAACFCHKKTVNVGFVCSVCLSMRAQEIAVEQAEKERRSKRGWTNIGLASGNLIHIEHPSSEEERARLAKEAAVRERPMNWSGKDAASRNSIKGGGFSPVSRGFPYLLEVRLKNSAAQDALRARKVRNQADL